MYYPIEPISRESFLEAVMAMQSASTYMLYDERGHFIGVVYGRNAAQRAMDAEFVVKRVED